MIEDINTGVEYIFEVEKENEIYGQFDKKFKQKSKTRSWTSKDPDRGSKQQGPSKGNGSQSITFGRSSGIRKHTVHAKRDDKSMS